MLAHHRPVNSNELLPVPAQRYQQLAETDAKVQVKCLRVLQYFPVPEDPVILKGLEEILKRIITGQQSCLQHARTGVMKG